MSRDQHIVLFFLFFFEYCLAPGLFSLSTSNLQYLTGQLWFQAAYLLIWLLPWPQFAPKPPRATSVPTIISHVMIAAVPKLRPWHAHAHTTHTYTHTTHRFDEDAWTWEKRRPIANLSLCVPPPVLSCLPPHPPPPPLVGQGGESGTGAPSYEQSFGRGLGPQADPRPLYRDLCAGHRQHAAQPGLAGPESGVRAGLPLLSARCDHFPPRGGGSASSAPSSPWGDPGQDTGPLSGSWQQHVAAASPAQQQQQPQCHHAVQTSSAQRGALPPEPWQDAHANVLPGSLRRTHTRSHWRWPQHIHIGGTAEWGGGPLVRFRPRDAIMLEWKTTVQS